MRLTIFLRRLSACLLLAAAAFLLSAKPAHAAITYFASASNPADDDTLDSTEVAVTPPASMQTGDLVIMVANNREADDTASIAATGGQTWTSQAANTTRTSQRIFWARYNGAWSANPSVAFPNNANSTTVVMHVFRPTSVLHTWALDTAQTDSNFASPGPPRDVTIAGITTITDGALVFATWATDDDNTWALQTAGWANAGGAQYRNNDGNDASQSAAYKIMPTAGASGNVTNRQATLGGDEGNASILAFKEVAPLPAPTVAKVFNATSIALNGTSTLTITITNPNATAITGLAFSDAYPAGLVNAATPALSNSCGGSATGAAGAGSLSLSGGTVAGNASCAVSVAVTSATGGSYLNSTGAVTADNAYSGASASATLTVVDCTSAASGNWSAPATWTNCRGGVPLAGDRATILGGHMVTLDVATPILGNVVNGGTLNASGAHTLSVGGSLTNNGTVSLGAANVDLYGDFSNNNGANFNLGAADTGTWIFRGAAVQNINSTGILTTFPNLALDNASGIALNASAMVKTQLTLTNGYISTGSNILTTLAACPGSVARSNGFVAGNLRLSFPAGTTTCTYHVGSGTTYAPIGLTVVTAAGGTLTGSTTGAEHAQVSTSGLNPLKDANRYWSLWTSGDGIGAVTSYGATFNFAAGDLDAAAAPGSFIVAKFAGNAWTLPTPVTVGGTSTGVSGITGGLASATDFAVGEVSANPGMTCYTDDFNRADGAPGADWTTTSSAAPPVQAAIAGSRLRLTNNTTNQSAAAHLQKLFPGAGQKVVVEFDYFAYDGTAADGIAVTLSDASVSPVAGAYGGSLGYAQRTTPSSVDGFAGGWIGVGIDEYGNYSNPTEGRNQGPGFRVDSVAVRGSGSGTTGYKYLAGTNTLAPGTDSNASIVAAPGHRYRITVDHSNSTNAYVSVDRDTGSGYSNLIAAFDAKADASQAAVPANWFLSYTGSTGANTNFHEIDNLSVCSTNLKPALHHIRIEHDGAGDTCGPETVTLKACANADCTVLYTDSVTTTLSPTGWTGGNTLSFSGGVTTVQLTRTAGTVTLGSAATSPSPTQAGRCFIGSSESCSMTFSVCPNATCAGSIAACSSGAVNTYYPGVGSAAAGATSVTVGTPTPAACATLKTNDQVLIVQMQDADIDTGNSAGYGAVSGGNYGLYEYAQVASVAGSTVNLTAPLQNSYSTAAYGASGQKTFQVIRVPVYSSGTLPAGLTAPAWNGSTGGVFAIDVTGNLALAGQTIDVSGKGFRGGGGRELTGGSGTSADYRTLATNNANGAKGEGIAGTPRYVDNAGVLANSGVEGYPSGSYGKGAPGNAGGGGTDDNPPANDENTGGGGGANAGGGGYGGYGWNAATSPGRGIGGRALSLDPTRLTLGGGGGAGTSNNGTTDGNGFNSSAGAGGGIIMLRAGSLSGSATLNANGADVTRTVTNDGSGGGGGGGAVMVYSGGGGLGGLTLNAKGGKGGNNTGGGTAHGPGGGGGGGIILASAAPLAAAVVGGAAGTTAGNVTYGAESGANGSVATNLTRAQMAGLAFGDAGPCASVDHYAVSHSGSGVTCEAEPVTVTAHDSAHLATDAGRIGGRIVTLTARNVANATASGTWLAAADSCMQTCYNTSGTEIACGGVFTATTPGSSNGTASYRFAAGEAGIRLCLKQSSAITENIDVSDGAATEYAGAAPAEDNNLVFSNTGFRFYANGTVDAIGALVAGLRSDVINGGHQPAPQTLTIRAVKSSTTTPARCVSLLGSAGTQPVQFAYQCIDPATCHPTLPKGLEVNSTPVAGSGGVPTPVDAVAVAFDANGYGAINLKYADVGKIQLYAQATVPDAATGGGVSIVKGASNSFVVNPFAFTLTGIKQHASPNKVNPGAGNATGDVFVKAGELFDAAVTAVGFDNATTPSFGLGTGSATEAVTLAYNLQQPVSACPGPADCAATLSGTGATTPLYRSDFTNGVASLADLSWSEVGIIKLTATSSTYLGNSHTTTGTSDNVGRFIPDHFAITAGAPLAACATGAAFTYFGQDGFSTPFTLSARNVANATTQNYTGAFAKLDLTDYDRFSFTAAVLPAGATLSSSATAPSGSWANGTTVDLTARHQVSRPTALAGPATITISAKPTDTDNVTIAAATEVTSTATTLRYGRLRLMNAYGSELLPILVPVRAEFFNGTRWLPNADDGCTTVPAASLALGNITTPGGAGLAVGAPPAGIVLSPAATLANGTTNIRLTPTTPGTGTLDMVLNLGTGIATPDSCLAAMAGVVGGAAPAVSLAHLLGNWCGAAADRAPHARIRFGASRAPYIYLRERY